MGRYGGLAGRALSLRFLGKTIRVHQCNFSALIFIVFLGRTKTCGQVHLWYILTKKQTLNV